MASVQLQRSDVANKRPLPSVFANGELLLNTAVASPGVFTKNTDSNLVKLGPPAVGTTSPNSTPAAGGATGNCLGELWFDTSLNPPRLKVYDGTGFVTTTPLDPLVGVTVPTFTQLGINTGTPSGANTTLLGYNAGKLCTSDKLTAVGAEACQSLGGYGVNGVAYGFGAGRTVTNLTNGILVGAEAGGQATSAQDCVGVGYQALLVNQAQYNVAIGESSLPKNTTGTNNTAVGPSSFFSLTTGSNNTGVGASSGFFLVNGSGNSFFGASAGRGCIADSSNNTMIGTSAGNFSGGAAPSFNNNVFIGYYAGGNDGTTNSVGCRGNNNIMIGTKAGIKLGNGDNNTVVGGYDGTPIRNTSGNVVIADASGNARFRANSGGAWAPDGTNFGTTGQVLKSNGTGSAPTWSNLANSNNLQSTTFQSFDGKTVTISNGLIVSIEPSS